MNKKKLKILIVLVVVLLIYLVIGIIYGIRYLSDNITTSGTAYAEKEHLYWKNIDVEVVSCDYHSWYASGTHMKCEITVKSEEYQLEESFSLEGQDAMKYQNCKNGDIIKAELFSWVIDSTGVITRREIHQLK